MPSVCPYPSKHGLPLSCPLDAAHSCRVWGCHGSRGGGVYMAAGQGARCPFQATLLCATVNTSRENLKEGTQCFFPLHFHPVWVQSRMVTIARKPNSIIKSPKEEKRRRVLVKNSLSEAHPALSQRACALLH